MLFSFVAFVNDCSGLETATISCDVANGGGTLLVVDCGCCGTCVGGVFGECINAAVAASIAGDSL